MPKLNSTFSIGRRPASDLLSWTEYIIVTAFMCSRFGYWLRLVAVALATGAAACDQPAAKQPSRLPDVRYDPTPHHIVAEMLKLARVAANDVVYDLGCGDGRIVIAAARTYGARGIGVDIDPARIDEARENARRAGVEHLVTFRVEDARATDLSDATVVTLYLVAALNAQLRPRLASQLRPGSRIVSHNFPIGDWEPDHVDVFRSADGQTRTVYLWKIG